MAPKKANAAKGKAKAKGKAAVAVAEPLAIEDAAADHGAGPTAGSV